MKRILFILSMLPVSTEIDLIKYWNEKNMGHPSSNKHSTRNHLFPIKLNIEGTFLSMSA